MVAAARWCWIIFTFWVTPCVLSQGHLPKFARPQLFSMTPLLQIFHRDYIFQVSTVCNDVFIFRVRPSCFEILEFTVTFYLDSINQRVSICAINKNSVCTATFFCIHSFHVRNTRALTQNSVSFLKYRDWPGGPLIGWCMCIGCACVYVVGHVIKVFLFNILCQVPTSRGES